MNELFTSLPMLMDLIVAILLVLVLPFSILIYANLRSFKKHQQKLDQQISTFLDATERAKKSIEQVENLSSVSSQSLLSRLNKAQAVKDELTFILTRATELSDKLEKQITASRQMTDLPLGTKKNDPITLHTDKPKGFDVSGFSTTLGKKHDATVHTQKDNVAGDPKDLLKSLRAIR